MFVLFSYPGPGLCLYESHTQDPAYVCTVLIPRTHLMVELFSYPGPGLWLYYSHTQDPAYVCTNSYLEPGLRLY